MKRQYLAYASKTSDDRDSVCFYLVGIDADGKIEKNSCDPIQSVTFRAFPSSSYDGTFTMLCFSACEYMATENAAAIAKAHAKATNALEAIRNAEGPTTDPYLPVIRMMRSWGVVGAARYSDAACGMVRHDWCIIVDAMRALVDRLGVCKAA